MKRRINSTDRKSINRELISIRLIEPEILSQPRSFTAELGGLAELSVPQTARVYVEPYVTGSSSSMRFDFGTVGGIVTPADTTLADLDRDGRILFRIKIVDGSAEVGKILASANALRPIDEKVSDDDRRAILPVRSEPLGEAVWELDLASQARPELVLNNRLPGLMDRIKTDPLLQGAIIPAAIGEILRCVLDPENADIDDDLDWVQDWKRWAADILGRPIDDESIDPEEVEAKRREIIEGFARMARFASRIEAVDAGGDVLPNE
jgi:hypothetical protein